LDDARTQLKRDEAQVASMEASVETAKLPPRENEIRAAEADARAAREVLRQADWRLGQRVVSSPAAGLVIDTYYVVGDWVSAGGVVASLLPPENVKIRFYVPETALGRLKLGQTLNAACDGCAAPVGATITFIGDRAEFTPPVLFSKDNRSKLVYLVEAKPSAQDALKLHPGQPVGRDAAAMSLPPGRPKEGSLPLGGKARSAKGAQMSTPDAGDIVIDVHGLNKSFGTHHVVKDLALTVRRGEIFGFLGPNGSGKTTTIRMLCGLLVPSGGEGTCLGYDILHETRQIKRPRRLHDAALFAVGGSHHPRESALHCANVRDGRHCIARRRFARPTWTDRSRRSARGTTLGWLEAAPCPRCVSAARAAAAVAR
jgi:ABC-type multidrug transport system fused ATPase/permease subunit